MPLLTSPIDGSPMRQINRFGIELDICPTSGGVWLDKGEIEKLIAIIKEGAEEEAKKFASYENRGDRREDPRYVEDDYRKANYREDEYRKPNYKESDEYYNKGNPKKKSALSQLMDVFDF